MKKMNANGRRALIAALASVMVLCLGVGSAFAYYNSVTEEKTNLFSPAENIRAKLIEPNWNPQEGLRLVPGKTVPKDPMVVNTCEIDEYVAIRLTFLGADTDPLSDEDLLELLNLLDITWNSRWKADPATITFDGSGKVLTAAQPLLFYYQDILSPGQTSEPVFSSIRCHDENDGLTEAKLRWLQGIQIAHGSIVPDLAGIEYCSIKVEGAAVQALGFANAEAAEGALKSLFPAYEGRA